MEKIKVDFSKIKFITHCATCYSRIGYTNPFATCFECKKRFYFDCIWGGQINSKMGKKEEIRSICDSCQKEHHYKTLA